MKPMGLRRLPWLLAVLALAPAAFLPGCSGKDPVELTDEGYRQLGRSDWTGARQSFERALRETDPSSDLFVRAKLGAIEALVRVDPGRARDEFLELASTHASQVEATDYSLIAGKLAGARSFSEAVDVMDRGLKAHPEHPKMVAVKDSIIEQSKKSGDSAALQKLRSLGYVGSE
jgi:hypothetical protein